jgi:hypothetical protein
MISHFPEDDSNPDAPRLLEVVLPPGKYDSPHPSLFGQDDLYHTGDLFEEVEPGFYVFRGRTGDWLKTLGGFCDTKWVLVYFIIAIILIISSIRSIEDNVRKTCADLVHDVVVLGTDRRCPVLFVETSKDISDDSQKLELSNEIIHRTAVFNQRLFLYERIEDPKHIRILSRGALPRTKVRCCSISIWQNS